MNKYLLGAALVAATTGLVTFYPNSAGPGTTAQAMNLTSTQQAATPLATTSQNGQNRPRIDLVFAIDTTGSMSGLIAAAKEKIWSIASTMAQGQPAPEIRIGLVAYRDHGDDYVTQVTDLSTDLDSVYAKLMLLSANGGGDRPEDVNQGLLDAVTKMSWRSDDQTYKVVFLVGDAPPHTDYQGEIQYPEIVAQARSRGIVINTIQCGSQGDTTAAWQQIAALAQGEFINVAQNGSAVAVATPFDDKLARLSVAMDATRLFYGDKNAQALTEKKLDAAAKALNHASFASRARRAEFNASASGAGNFLGDSELVDAVASGRVDLKALPAAVMPAPLQMLAPAARAVVVKEKAEQRAKIKNEIAQVAKERDAFIESEVAAAGGAKDSLDQKLHDVIGRQALKAGVNVGTQLKY